MYTMYVYIYEVQLYQKLSLFTNEVKDLDYVIYVINVLYGLIWKNYIVGHGKVT